MIPPARHRRQKRPLGERPLFVQMVPPGESFLIVFLHLSELLVLFGTKVRSWRCGFDESQRLCAGVKMHLAEFISKDIVRP